MEEPRIQEAVRRFSTAYEAALGRTADLSPVGLWAGVLAVMSMPVFYVAHLDEVPTLSTEPHEIAEETTSEEVVNMWDALKQGYMALWGALGGADPKGLEGLIARLRMTEQRADQLQARLDAVEKRAGGGGGGDKSWLEAHWRSAAGRGEDDYAAALITALAALPVSK